MSDHEFEQQLRATFRDNVDTAASPALHARIHAVPKAASTPGRREWPAITLHRSMTAVLAAAAVILVVAAMGVVFAPRSPKIGPPGPTTTPSGTPRTAANLAGTWTAAEPMTVRRDGYTATLLHDGKVLVAGGSSASPELYDPSTESWTPTGSMVTPRGGHTATLLSDGRVLVVGGYLTNLDNNSVFLGSAELYDPTTGTWTATEPMIEVRGRGHTSTLLPDGKVLVAGGYIDTGANGTIPTDSAELYDPASGGWTAIGRMSLARTYHVAVLLPDGRVLVAGSLHSEASAELYDPQTGTWAPTGRMLTGRHDFQALLMRDGRVLVAGGEGVAHAVELYDADTETWTETGSLTDGGIGFFTLTLLSDGTVLASGMDGSAERYEPAVGNWTPTGGDDPTDPGHPATLLPDGTVIVFGPGEAVDSPSSHMYTPANDR